MSATIGTGDLFSGGSASGTTSQSASLAQGNVGATLDLSSLQSIQGHTINDGLTANEALSFASLIAQTASNSTSSATQAVTSSISTTINSVLKSPLVLAGAGVALFFIVFKLLKKGR